MDSRVATTIAETLFELQKLNCVVFGRPSPVSTVSKPVKSESSLSLKDEKPATPAATVQQQSSWTGEEQPAFDDLVRIERERTQSGTSSQRLHASDDVKPNVEGGSC
jgi:hypothetical protein